MKTKLKYSEVEKKIKLFLINQKKLSKPKIKSIKLFQVNKFIYYFKFTIIIFILFYFRIIRIEKERKTSKKLSFSFE